MDTSEQNDTQKTTEELTTPKTESPNPADSWDNPTTPSDSGQAAITSDKPIHKKSFWDNKILLAALAVYVVNFGALAIAYTTTEYEVAKNMIPITYYIGILGALLLGAGAAQAALNSIQHHGGHMNGMLITGIVLLMLSMVLGPLSLIPGIILLLLGLRRPPATNPVPMSTTKKFFIALGTFVGGGIAGLAVSFMIYLMTSDRACQLSSSKCY